MRVAFAAQPKSAPDENTLSELAEMIRDDLRERKGIEVKPRIECQETAEEDPDAES